MAEDNKTTANPAQRPGEAPKAERKRIPMSIPQRKLEVPEMSGYHLHWFRELNVPRALQAGYEMVKADEVHVNQFNVGTASGVSGNADLGSNVKVIGGTGEDGKAEHLILMKIREEWWKEDQKILENRNSSVLEAIFNEKTIKGVDGEAEADRAKRYIPEGQKPLLQRARRKV